MINTVRIEADYGNNLITEKKLITGKKADYGKRNKRLITDKNSWVEKKLIAKVRI